MKAYETIIGIEVHVELATKSKIFCSCTTRFGGEPNTQCCPVCMGMPGTLPVLNKKVVEYALAAGIALNCSITKKFRFDRKNYYYPDLPKAYQISQLYLPIAKDGSITIDTDDGTKVIRIREVHMEEDAGKLIHDPHKNYTLVDYNRCGVPLIEIVSEPDIRSAGEAVVYLEKLKLILQYLGISDCKMQEGSLRADINLSVREAGSDIPGIRTEMKNMNSFKAIARAIECESSRQIELLELGHRIIRETRRWDDNEGKSFAMRSKEEAMDYRYFPEPDIPVVELDDSLLAAISAGMPEMREEKLSRYVREYGLPEYDAGIITASRHLADLFEATTALCNNPREVSNWIMVETMRLLKEQDMEPEDIRFSPSQLSCLIVMLDSSRINRTVAKEVFEKVFTENADPEEYVKMHNLGLVTDYSVLKAEVERVISDNSQSVADYRRGKMRVIGYLVGQVMKNMRGTADPAAVNVMVKDILDSTT